MPTLKQYEEMGVDITYLTTEQLQADGYVTPMNEMPVIVDGPGVYLCRDGRKAVVDVVRPSPGLHVTAFQVIGGYEYKRPSGKFSYQYCIWHVSGRCNLFHESKADIVSKTGERNV
jgi:hypothetical protein